MSIRVSLLLAALLLASPLAHAKKDGGKAGNPHAEEGRRAGAAISIGISVGEARDLAREAGVRPGSYKPLPPGMYKRLAKGKPLPPGIAKKQVPPAMLPRLPAHPGHEWLVIGVDLVLVNIRTRLTIDILPGVF